MTLDRYDPPGYLDDYAAIPGQLDAWSAAVSGWIDENIEIAREKLPAGAEPQFFNAMHGQPAGPVLDQPLVWSGFPGTWRNRFGRAQALVLADTMVPLTERMDGPGSYFVGPQWQDLFYRPQDEYCEWRVTRDAQGRITAVTFTSEPPEYWQALNGDTLPDMNGDPKYPFPGDHDLLVELYRELVSPDVQYEDLICAEDLVDLTDPANPVVVYAKGTYNPYNRWNTTGGIVHLTQPASSLSAEINLAAVATVLRRGADGKQVSDPDALICCAAYGGVDRCSDPTIGSSVNELAAIGAAVTLRNPVGLSMNHFDLAGILTPSGEPVTADFFQVLRGRSPELIERAVFAVPDGSCTVSDLTIGGVPITHGGQLAERMTVNLVGRAVVGGAAATTPVACTSGCCVDGDYLAYRHSGGADPCRPEMVPAFVETSPVAAARSMAEVAFAVTPPAPPTRHQHRTRSA